MAPINTNDPLNLTHFGPWFNNFWGTAQTYSGDWGGRATNQGLTCGVFNQADNYGTPSSKFNSDNTSPKGATLIRELTAPMNPALVVRAMAGMALERIPAVMSL